MAGPLSRMYSLSAFHHDCRGERRFSRHETSVNTALIPHQTSTKMAVLFVGIELL